MGILLANFGENHPLTAIAMDNLGCVNGNLGDFETAEAQIKRALDIFLGVLGEDHPDSQTAFRNLAALYQKMGDSRRAEIYRQKAIHCRKDVLKENINAERK